MTTQVQRQRLATGLVKHGKRGNQMKHLKENNETYLSHFKFATKMGLTLMLRGGIFLLHCLLPVCEVPEKLNLNSTCNFLKECNKHAEDRKK